MLTTVETLIFSPLPLQQLHTERNKTDIPKQLPLYDPRRIQPIRQQLRSLQRSELRTSKRMLAAHGTQDARKEHAGELCRGKSGRDNGRAALSALRARPQGTLGVGHLPHLRQRARRRPARSKMESHVVLRR